MEQKLRVLHSFGPEFDAANPYVRLLRESMSADVESNYFTWKAALFNRYDVLHVHWPEALVRGSSRVATTAKFILLQILLVRCRLLRVPLVRTLHNSSPHELSGNKIERRGLLKIDRSTTLTIILNSWSANSVPGETRIIPHGHYKSMLHPAELDEKSERLILFFGMIRPYKGVSELLSAFVSIPRSDNDEPTLTVAGQCKDAELKSEIENAVRHDDRIEFRGQFLPDCDLYRLISSCSIVVLPYSRFENSGAALLALSLSKPLLLRSSETAKELRDEAGPGWVQTFDGVLTAEVLLDALAVAQRLAGEPALDPDRDWIHSAAQTINAYRDALILKGHEPNAER